MKKWWIREGYPSNWQTLRLRRLKIAKERCECRGGCHTSNHGRRRCSNRLGLQAAHLCHDKSCAKLEDLRMMCPQCHAGYDGRVLLTKFDELQAEPPPHVLEDLTLLDAWIFRHDYDVFSGVAFPAGTDDRFLKFLFPF